MLVKEHFYTVCGIVLRCRRFWKEVAILIFKMVSINLPMKPEIFILESFPENIVYSSSTRKRIDICILQAKCLIATVCIARKWKNHPLYSGPTTYLLVCQCKGLHHIFKGKVFFFFNLETFYILYFKLRFL